MSRRERLTELISDFLKDLAAGRGFSPRTLEAYRRDLEDFLGYLQRAGRTLPVVGAADIGAYLRELSQAGLAPASRARRLSTLRQLFKFLTAEGVKQAQILTAEGEKQAAILSAEGQRQASILRAQGDAEATRVTFQAIHDGDPSPDLLTYQYIQALPKVADGKGMTLLLVPSDAIASMGAISALGSALQVGKDASASSETT